jgi:CheY-like chemotaxis protein
VASILIIEADVSVLETTAGFLTLAGFNVIVAANGPDGIDLALRLRPNLILCDISMPEMADFAVLSALKQNPNTSHISYLIFTSNPEPSAVERGLKLGASGYVRKLLSEEELLS